MEYTIDYVFMFLLFALNGQLVRACKSKKLQPFNAFMFGVGGAGIALIMIIAFAFVRKNFLYSDAVFVLIREDMSIIDYAFIVGLLIFGAGLSCYNVADRNID